MAWRGLHVSRPATLLLRHRQCVVSQEGEETGFPLEDLAWIVLDTKQAMLSGPLLSALAMNGIPLLVPDDRHHPAGMLLPFHAHFAQARIAHLQIEASEPFRKRAWQGLVTAKIANQANALKAIGGAGWERLLDLSTRVASGDVGNVEAQAARFYWSRFFEKFTREPGMDRRNSLLDYGYAVVRAAIARACVAYGLLPAFGLHHRSQVNAFNLVDDLIEPYRPFVDLLAHSHVRNRPRDGSEPLDVEDRRAMVGILTRTVVFPNGETTLLAAAERTAASLAKSLESKDFRQVEMPKLES